MKLLIVEDQRNTLEALEFAVNNVIPNYFPDFTKESYEVSRCYLDTQNRILENDYEVILLDNRMPYEDQTELEISDFSRFSATLENIGYNLIPVIKEKNPSTLVIGTSSLSKKELKDMPSPDFTMRKDWCDSPEDLERIFKAQ
jgi:CheY-like chemotaxis protein